jgi:hypothetical protein
MEQTSLLPAPPARPAPAAARVTSKGIGKGDIVEVDRKGRRFHALVTGIQQDPKGYHHLELRPFDRRVSYRTATVRDVVTIWRRVT